MARPILILSLGAALLAASPGPGAPPAREAASAHHRLAWLAPAGGGVEMGSTRFRLRAVVSPPLSGPMRSRHYRIRPSLPAPGPVRGRPCLVALP